MAKKLGSNPQLYFFIVPTSKTSLQTPDRLFNLSELSFLHLYSGLVSSFRVIMSTSQIILFCSK